MGQSPNCSYLSRGIQNNYNFIGLVINVQNNKKDKEYICKQPKNINIFHDYKKISDHVQTNNDKINLIINFILGEIRLNISRTKQEDQSSSSSKLPAGFFLCTFFFFYDKGQSSMTNSISKCSIRVWFYTCSQANIYYKIVGPSNVSFVKRGRVGGVELFLS